MLKIINITKKQRRDWTFWLQIKYGKRKSLEKMVELLILQTIADEAKKDLKEFIKFL